MGKEEGRQNTLYRHKKKLSETFSHVCTLYSLDENYFCKQIKLESHHTLFN